jgi:hypothetical protein
MVCWARLLHLPALRRPEKLDTEVVQPEEKAHLFHHGLADHEERHATNYRREGGSAGDGEGEAAVMHGVLLLCQLHNALMHSDLMHSAQLYLLHTNSLLRTLRY